MTSRARSPRRTLASVGTVLLLLTGLVGGLSVAPSAAESAPSEPTMASTAVTGPESGPQLTAATWRLAIGTAVVTEGATRLGKPYVYSAGGPDAFDCSGFVRWAWLQLGVELPHNSVAMWDVVERIPFDQLQPGDIVFDSLGGPPSHVGLYVGDGMMIHAPNSGGVVRYDRVGWWNGATVTAGRLHLPD